MRVTWTSDEQESVRAEAIRLVQVGKATTLAETVARAQLVLPKNRRRNIATATTAKVPWLTAAIQAAKVAAETPKARAAVAKKASNHKVHWKDDEKQLLCAAAAQLTLDLQAHGPRDALEKAILTLPADRQRTIPSMTLVADWFFKGMEQARAELVKAREEAAVQAKQAAKEPPVTTAAPTPDPAPEATAPPVQAPPSPPTLTSMFGGWTRLREHLVQEVASIVTEGIQRGLANVQIVAPVEQNDTPTSGAHHVPFVVDPHPKERHPSVLVVGLRGAQGPQIKAEFGSRLDLRFCSVDQSKDQLRSMTEQADMTVAVVDFLSHSHTGIVKARAKRFVESSGGMTALRSELARIAGSQLNGSGHASV